VIVRSVEIDSIEDLGWWDVDIYLSASALGDNGPELANCSEVLGETMADENTA